MYLTEAAIANDIDLRQRVAQCAANEGVLDAGIDPDQWTIDWRREWAAAEGWSEAWEYMMSQETPPENPGADPAVITDGMILVQVRKMKPYKLLKPPV